MAFTLTKYPDPLQLSGNPVLFEISTDTTGVNFHEIHLRITFNGELKGEDALSVINGKAEFDISDYLKTEQNGHFCFDENLKPYDLLKPYSVEYFETYNNDGIEYENTFLSNFKIMQGKLGNYDIPGTTYYEKYFNPDNISVMSFSKGQKYMYKHEDDFIYIFVPNASINLGYIKIDFVFYLNDGTVAYKEIAFSATSEKITLIQTGYNNIIKDLINEEEWKNNIYKYVLSIAYLDNTPRNYTILYQEYILKESLSDNKQIVVKNRLGVYEVIHLNGISENETEFSRQFSESDEMKNILSGSSKKIIKANTGWITEEEYENILILLESKDSYLIKNELNIPIIITSKKSSKNRSDNFLYSIDIEFEYAEEFNF